MSEVRCMDCMQVYDESMSVCPHCGHRRNQPKKELYYLNEETILAGRYLSGKVMSEDSFGITYIAWDLLEECKVVIKEYLPKDCATRNMSQDEVVPYDGEKGARFADGLAAYLETAEGLISVSDNVEGIVRIKDSFIENSTGYYVMEYLDGVSLSEVLKGGKMRWNDVISILTPMMVSLQRIHDVELGNYNISPDNIVMTRSHEVKLRGFESVNLNDEENRKQKKATTEFSAYEMYQTDGRIDARADVYSLAAVIYYAVTGVKPPLAVDRYAKDTLEPPSKLKVNLPGNVETALLNALNVEPKYRTRSVSTFLDEIHSEAPVKRINPPKRKADTGRLSKKAKAIIAAAAAVTVCAVVGIFVFLSFAGNNVNSKTVTVPDFTKYNIYSDEKIINQKLKKLNAELEKLGVTKISARLSQGQQVDKTTDSKYKKFTYNDIVDQDYKGECDADTLSTAGAITVTTIKPEEKYRMPDFCDGKTKVSEAKKWITDRKLKYEPKRLLSKKYKENTIVYQSPNAGKDSYVKPGETVTLTISKVPKPKPKPETKPTQPATRATISRKSSIINNPTAPPPKEEATKATPKLK